MSSPPTTDIFEPSGRGRVLSVVGLDSGYTPLQVLWDICLSVEEGEWLALLGPNGAGKSTLLSTIAGLIKPFCGRIVYHEKEIGMLPVHERVRLGIALVPEGRKLFSGMTVKENLMMGAFIQNDAEKIAGQLNRVLDLFPILKERETQIVGTLSGGERQMCAVGRALMSLPALLLVDEMSLGLGPVVVDGLLETMAAVRKEGVTLIVVEQDVHTALTYADRGYVLREGRMVKSGKATHLLEDPGIQKAYLGYGE
ncbi:MAG: ABC transporter ATP-binding protein [Deltaproteobacteria bacterium]|nr:ABC transporter ATP-binding protein [Deltaproteobacteria bacterium]